MDLKAFCRESRVLIVVGKGGVGKTTVSAALALAAARAGLSVLIAALDERGPLAALFGTEVELTYDEQVLTTLRPMKGETTEVRGRILTSDGALVEYLESHGLGKVIKRLVQSGALDVVSSAIPGIREVLVLGKLRQLEEAEAADLIILDAPASGHAVSLLTSSEGLVDVARGGPLRAQAEQVLELLREPARCHVLLVTLPEETPINETVETAYRLEEEVGVYLGPIVVNGCYPDAHLPSVAQMLPELERAGISGPVREQLLEAARFRLAREALQASQLERLGEAVALEQIRLPFLFETELGPAALSYLADALVEQIGLL